MKRVILATLLAVGLTQSIRAANLEWNPTDASWDFTTSNWKNTDTTAMVPFANGDNVVFNDSGLGQPTVALGANLLSPNSVLMDSWATYTLSSATGGKLANVFSLTKRGSGTLILDADNVITNHIAIEDGIVQIGAGAGRGALGTGSVTNNGTLAFNRTGTLNMSNNMSGSGTLSIPATAAGTWNLYGNNTMTDYSIVHNGNMPLIFRPPGSLGAPKNVQISADSGVNVRIQVGGQIHFPVTCPISATLAYGNNAIRFSLMGIAGSNSVSGPIGLAGGNYSDPNSRPQVNLYAQNSGSELTVYSSVSESDVGNPYVGDFFLRGSGLAGRMYGTFNLPNAQFQKVEAVTWTIYSTGNKATVSYMSAGRLNMGAANALPLAQLTVVTPAILDLAGFSQNVGPLWGSGVITNSSTTSDALLTLANGGAYTGTIKDSGTTKIGLKLLNPGAPSTQQLLGNCSYSGATTLDIATALALGDSGLPNTTPIEMGNGSSLDLSTKTDKTFTLGAAQTLKGDGTVHVNGNLICQGTISLKVAKASGIVTADKLIIDSSYSITYGGTLSLNLSGEALTSTDTLKLFDVTSPGSYNGAFTLVPAKPGTGLAWDTSTLTTDGVLRIAASIPTNPTNITYSVVSGGTELQIAWPSDYTGWTLQGQTNALTVGINNNWFNVPDSANTNRIVLPIDPKNGAVFYRLYYTKP